MISSPACLAAIHRSFVETPLELPHDSFMSFDEDASTHAAFNLLYNVVGFAMEEQAFLQKYGNPTSSERDATRSSFEILLNSEHGAVKQCLEPILDSNFDKRFELGITVHIQGVKRLAAGH